MAMAFQEKMKFKIIGLGNSKDSKKNNDQKLSFDRKRTTEPFQKQQSQQDLEDE